MAEVEDLIDQGKKKGRPVAGMIIEPIQAEGGDHHASPEFFQGLQKLGKKVKLRNTKYYLALPVRFCQFLYSLSTN